MQVRRNHHGGLLLFRGREKGVFWQEAAEMPEGLSGGAPNGCYVQSGGAA